MFTSLNPGAIGVSVDGLEQSLRLAAKHGFAGCHFSIVEAHDLGVERTRDLAEAAGVRLSAFGFPLDFRGDEETFDKSLADLRDLAPPASGASGAASCSRRTSGRRRPARILADNGIRLGLEYVGPKTSRQGKAHAFVHTMNQMSELCEGVGDNCGYLLDAWHWYTAREDALHLQRLSVEQVVDVHVNDAPDKPVEDQIDNQRCLPGETGVIDIATFLGSLQAIGYDGPVMVEPFSQRVREMAADDACAATAASLKKVFDQAGV